MLKSLHYHTILMINLDVIRVWNAANHLKVSIAELVKNFDSVSACLSKGLGAPAGDILVWCYVWQSYHM